MPATTNCTHHQFDIIGGYYIIKLHSYAFVGLFKNIVCQKCHLLVVFAFGSRMTSQKSAQRLGYGPNVREVAIEGTTRQQICALSTKVQTGTVAYFVLLRYRGTQQ